MDPNDMSLERIDATSQYTTSFPSTPNSGKSTPMSLSSSAPKERRFYFVTQYAISFRGLIRLFIILSQLGGWISALLIFKVPVGTIVILPSSLNALRISYLVFSISGFSLAGIIHAFYLFNLNNLKLIQKLPSIVIYIVLMVTDLIWMIAMVVLSILCIVRIIEVKNQASTSIINLFNSLLYYLFVDIGALASAVVFGFVSAGLYAIDIIMHIRLVLVSRKGPTESRANLNLNHF